MSDSTTASSLPPAPKAELVRMTMTDDEAAGAAYFEECGTQFEKQSVEGWPCPLLLPYPQTAAEQEALRLFVRLMQDMLQQYELALPFKIDFLSLPDRPNPFFTQSPPLPEKEAREVDSWLEECMQRILYQWSHGKPGDRLQLPPPRTAAAASELQELLKFLEKRAGKPVTIDFDTEGGKQ